VADSEILLTVTIWLTWAIRSVQNGSEHANADSPISNVSLQRLRELASRIEPNSSGTVTDRHIHQLVRFNVYNFGAQSVTLHAIALKNLHGETLCCELAPVAVAAGARYPMLFEVMKGPVYEAAEIEVEVRGRRLWVLARALPRS